MSQTQYRTYSQEEYDDLFSVKKDREKEAPSGSLMAQLSQDENFEVISRYMDDRFGMTTDQYDKEEIIDSYVNNMRKFCLLYTSPSPRD